MNKKPNIMMILAAGRGTRMKSLTNDRPKPLISVNGRTLLERIIDHAIESKLSHFVINVCYKADMIKEVINKQSNITASISYEKTAFETGGGVLKALPLLLPEGENGFFVSNADPLWVDKEKSIFDQLADEWDPNCMDVLLALIPKTHAFGDINDGNYFIENGKPRRQRAGESNIPYVFTGVQILHPRIFENIPPHSFSLRELYDIAEKKGRLGYVIYDGDWYHVGTPQALSETEKKIDTNR